MSDFKFYDLGVVCGRFGHEQLGHVSLFNNCMSLCKRTLISVGSAQESAPEDLVGTAELIIPRSTIPISATMVRGYLVINDEKHWQECTHPLIHGMYERLRYELMSVPIYQNIYNHIRKGELSLDHFMKLYHELEIQDKNEKLAHIPKSKST